MREKTLEDLVKEIRSITHNLISINFVLGSLQERIMNLEGFMSYQESINENLKKE